MLLRLKANFKFSHRSPFSEIQVWIAPASITRMQKENGDPGHLAFNKSLHYRAGLRRCT